MSNIVKDMMLVEVLLIGFYGGIGAVFGNFLIDEFIHLIRHIIKLILKRKRSKNEHKDNRDESGEA